MRLPFIALAAVSLASAASAQLHTSGPMLPPGIGTPGGGGFLGGNACTIYDDGVTENSLGLTNGGWLCHMQYIDCLAVVDEVLSAYGSAMFPGNIVNGRPVRVVIWTDSDTDEDPTTGLTWQTQISTSVMNGSTDVLNAYPMPATLVNSSAWIGAAVQHSAGEFPAPMDTTNPTPRSWTFGQGTGPIDLMNINNNNVPPASMDSLGFGSAFLLHADGGATLPEPGTGFCFCDAGSAFPAGACGNPGDVGNGCANGSSPGGANLKASGQVNPDTVVLEATGAIPSQPGLFFQGTNAINGGTGILFGDGLRCAGMNVIRLEVRLPDATGAASTTISVSTKGMVSPGDLRHYQYWYRDPSGSPCGNGFNLTNGYTIQW